MAATHPDAMAAYIKRLLLYPYDCAGLAEAHTEVRTHVPSQ